MLERSYGKRFHGHVNHGADLTENALSTSSLGLDVPSTRGSLFAADEPISMTSLSTKGLFPESGLIESELSRPPHVPTAPAFTGPTNPFFVVPFLEIEGVSVDTGRRNSLYASNYVQRESVYQPFRKVTLCWDTISVAKLPPEAKLLFIKKSKKAPVHSAQLLRSVSGVVNAGELIAILGPTNSGKSILLEVLSGRLSEQDYQVDGKMYVNNQEADSKVLLKTIGYVPEQYPFYGALTVREHLTFHAFLRIDERYTTDEKSALVEDILREIDLSRYADHRIGIRGRMNGLSLCEERILAIATESLTNTPALCCDEPLAGVDGFEAERVMGFLKSITGRGKIVICGLTRPTSETFGLCDKLAVLHGGRMAFFGALDEAVPFFGSVGFGFPSAFNPADHYVSCLAGTSALSELERNEQAKFICDKYLMSTTFDKIRKKLENTTRMARICTTAKTIRDKSIWQTGLIFQLMILLWRGSRGVWRDPFQLGLRFALHAFLGLTIGIIFLQQDSTSKEGIQALNGVLWLFMAFMCAVPLIGILAVFLPQLKLVQYEIRENIYSASAFFVTHCLLQLPQHVCFSGLLITLSYWLVGLYSSAEAYVIAWCVVCLTTVTAEGFFLLIAIAIKRVDLTLGVSFAVAFPLFLLNGYLPRMMSVPGWMNWLSYLSWFRYCMDALTSNQWRFIERSWQSDYSESNSSLTSSSASDVIAEMTGLATLGSLTFDCGMLVGLTVTFHVCGFLLLLQFVQN